MVLVLALLWVSFGVWWFKNHAQAGLGNSVGSFRRDLHVLERTAPVTVRPANRLRVPGGTLTSVSSRPVRSAAPRPGAPRPAARPVRRSSAAVKRRRDVLFVLLLTVGATLVMAVATRSHALVGIQLLADAALAGYVALLVRMRNLAAERDMKLTYLPAGRRPARAVGGRAEGGYGAYAAVN